MSLQRKGIKIFSAIVLTAVEISALKVRVFGKK
jgi:hypothetical protein